MLNSFFRLNVDLYLSTNKFFKIFSKAYLSVLYLVFVFVCNTILLFFYCMCWIVQIVYDMSIKSNRKSVFEE